MKKDVIVVANFCGNLDGRLNNRFVYLSEMLADKCDIELITSNFYHTLKKRKELAKGYKSKITLLHEPGYKKNISISRLFSHYIFARNLKHYLSTRKNPDVIYCAIPTLAAAKICMQYARKNNVKFVIDIQDLWPESFGLFLRNPALTKLITLPLMSIAEKIYSKANAIVAVSETFVKRALEFNKMDPVGTNVYIGADMSVFDKLKNESPFESKPKNEIWITYLGTLGHSYDIKTVIDALSILKSHNISNLKFIIIGGGPLKEEFEKYAIQKEIQVNFVGIKEYPEVVGLLCISDIAVNPIIKGSVASIINKHADYAMAGLPVINTQESIEYSGLIYEYNCGINCDVGNAKQIAEAIKLLAMDESLRKLMGQNSRILAEQKFDRKTTYKAIENLILN